MACPLCKTEASSLAGSIDRHGKPLETRSCDGCGLVFSNPIPTDEELSRFYSVDYRKEYKGTFQPRGRQIVRNFRRMDALTERFADVYANADTVLDVGAGSGEFTFAMTKAGKKAKGIEPNKEYSEYCRSQLGIDVETLEVFDAKFQEGSFDHINLSHVLEHLNDPIRYLKVFNSWLAPGGTLYVEVPDIFVLTRDRSRNKMFHYGHIFNYSPWTLRTAAGMAGMEEVPTTEQRCENSTGVYFQKAKKALAAKDALSETNAKAVKAAIDTHNRVGPSQPLSGKLFYKAVNFIDETATSIRLGSPKDIGNALLKAAS